jgi:hypothetical protein
VATQAHHPLGWRTPSPQQQALLPLWESDRAKMGGGEPILTPRSATGQAEAQGAPA